MASQRGKYPRINCAVPGCKRGTTTFEPGTTMICGKCWRKAPKSSREGWSKWRRRARTIEKRGDYERADLCERRAGTIFHHILELLSGADLEADGLPPLMAEELRKLGLL